MATQTKLITYDDYRNLPDDGKRYEIIEGELLMTPSPKIIHQRISQRISNKLYNFIENNGGGEVFSAPIDVVLSMTDIVQPDVLFVAKERSPIITEKNIVEAPDMVAEIASESTKIRDQTTKKTLYEEYGVKEYWIIYPDDEKAEQFVLQDETFDLKSKLKKPAILTSEVISGFLLPLEEIIAA